MNNKNSILRTQFFQNLAQLCDNPPCIEISYGKDCFLYDKSGKEYIDFISGISVSSFGHNNKKIIEAVKC
jgi:acetylornithine/succinyldiaminopimelate/putrescine aminotransferase